MIDLFARADDHSRCANVADGDVCAFTSVLPKGYSLTTSTILDEFQLRRYFPRVVPGFNTICRRRAVVRDARRH